jgi:hypothetical protein
MLATGYGPFLPVGDRQLSKAQRPVSRFAPELAASECRAVVISARCPLRVMNGCERTQHDATAKPS